MTGDTEPVPARLRPKRPSVDSRAAPRERSEACHFKGETDIQIDGTPGTLVDLSLTGAQLLTRSAMKPNRLITVTLPLDDSSIVCNAKVMWARLEPRSGQLWYRAGVAFTSADQPAIQTLS